MTESGSEQAISAQSTRTAGCASPVGKRAVGTLQRKMVAPLPIETRLARHPWIAQAVLHAEGRKFVSALIALRPEMVERWAAAKGLSELDGALVLHPLVIAEIQKAVDDVNATLSRAEGIRRFVLINRELSVAESELTPTHKVKRSTVLEKYSAQLDALYG